MSIAPTTVVKQAKDQLSCNLDDEVAILNMKSTLYFGLNEVGAFIWNSMQEPQPVIEICRAVANRYEIDDAQCQADVVGFLNKLKEAGLIELMPPWSSSYSNR
jgi:hypothetical protein